MYIRSKNRDVRINAFKNLYDGYKSLENTITSLYSSILNYDSINAKLRGYNSSIESYLDGKNISVKLYENLIKSVHSNLPNLYKYFEIKREMLGLDKFHLYDGYASTIKEIDKKYSFEEAKELVLDALKVYGEEYSNKLKEAFDNRWIDKYPNKNKRGGAYSTGSYDTVPYVLLNYTEEYNDVSTLAHELGHSMHTYFSCKNQPFATHDYVIFLAEIASTTNELILNDYMFKRAKTKEEKLAILNEKLDLFKGTIYRQTMFAEFEKNAHDYVDKGGVVTSDYLNNMYYDLNKKYFGEDVVVDEEIKYEWLRIPHFYTPFYVYQYATSLSISCYVAKNILEETPGFKEKYLELLKSGGKDYPLELLKIIDISLDDTKVFDSANEMFNKTLEKFIEIYKK
jgi:oligoendopeptidase F